MNHKNISSALPEDTGPSNEFTCKDIASGIKKGRASTFLPVMLFFGHCLYVSIYGKKNFEVGIVPFSDRESLSYLQLSQNSALSLLARQESLHCSQNSALSPLGRRESLHCYI